MKPDYMFDLKNAQSFIIQAQYREITGVHSLQEV